MSAGDNITINACGGTREMDSTLKNQRPFETRRRKSFVSIFPNAIFTMSFVLYLGPEYFLLAIGI